MALFNEDVNSQIIDESEIEEKTISFFSQLQDYYPLNKALSYFFMVYGPICKTGVIKKKLKQFEKSGRLEVQREPPFTKGGRPTSFMEEKTSKKNKQKVLIKWAK